MSDNEFDELFRSRLKDHPSAVPEDMWRRIAGKAEGRRRFSPWRWYYIGPVVLVAGLVLGPRLWRVPPTGVTTAPVARQTPATPQTPPASQTPVARQTPATPVPAVPHPVAARQLPVVPHLLSANHTSAQPTYSGPSDPFSQTHSVLEPAAPRSGRSGSVPRSQPGPGFSFTTAEPRRPTTRPVASGQSVSQAASDPTALPVSAGQTALPAASGLPAPHWPAPHQLPLAEPTSRSFTSPFAHRPGGKPQPRPDPGNIEPNSGWFAEAYFSPDFLFTSHRMGFSYSAGARVGKTFDDRFSVAIGLQFSHVSLGPIPDSIASQQFNNIDIPVLLGYQFSSSNLTTSFHLGLIWNLHSQAVVPDYGMSFRPNTGLAIYSGIDFLRSLNSHWSLFAEPHVRYQLTNRTANLLQSPDLGGLSLGVRYNF